MWSSGRRLTKMELVGAALVVTSLLVGVVAAGLGGWALWLLAGSLFLTGDVLYLIGAIRGRE